MEESNILSYIKGELSERECRAVEKWITQSDENLQIYKEFYRTWQLTTIVSSIEKCDVKRAKVRFYRSISYRSNKFLRLPRRAVYSGVAAVVAVVVLLISEIIFLSIDYSVDPTREVAQQFVELKTAKGVSSKMVLPDGTEVCLSGDSYIKYPSSFENISSREVVINGLAYFSVAHDSLKPFKVSTLSDYSVSVLGTKFVVSAYKNDNKISITLIEGSVKLNYDRDNELMLKPNQRAVYLVDGASLTVDSVDVASAIDWIDGRTIFDSVPLQEALYTLERKFGVQFVVKDSLALKSQITADFGHKGVYTIMDYLEIACDIKFKIEESLADGIQVIYVYKK